MKKTDIAIVGGGPAGLCASIAAAKMGAKVTLIERNSALGGQLVKQTHMFFGSQKQHASTRGIDICNILQAEVEKFDNIEVLTDTTVLGMYEDGVITMDCKGEYKKLLPSRIIVATGASEKFLPFDNNDLPGIYGAGAVQTLMNVYGIKPADSVVMVGAGNIGLIVSYQLMQAGVKVNAIIDAARTIGGYLVHASKVARLGVPILTSTTVKSAHGNECLTGITTVDLDENWQEIKGSEQYLPCDNLCISVGLSPLAELLWQIGCEMKYIPTLGGFVPTRDMYLKTSIDSVYIAGDVAGIEEASSAMVEGSIAGLCASKSIGFDMPNFDTVLADYIEQANSLRSGPVGEKIRQGLAQVEVGGQTK